VQHAATTTYDDLRARVTTLTASMERSPIVAICGHGGAGKSTLAARLMTDLGGKPDQVVTTDRFYAVGAGAASGCLSFTTGLPSSTCCTDSMQSPARNASSIQCAHTKGRNAPVTSPCHRWSSSKASGCFAPKPCRFLI
jgi:ABC-type dipeptide/oligopeptide/nickel transport system ATPase component